MLQSPKNFFLAPAPFSRQSELRLQLRIVLKDTLKITCLTWVPDFFLFGWCMFYPYRKEPEPQFVISAPAPALGGNSFSALRLRNTGINYIFRFRFLVTEMSKSFQPTVHKKIRQYVPALFDQRKCITTQGKPLSPFTERQNKILTNLEPIPVVTLPYRYRRCCTMYINVTGTVRLASSDHTLLTGDNPHRVPVPNMIPADRFYWHPHLWPLHLHVSRTPCYDLKLQ